MTRSAGMNLKAIQIVILENVNTHPLAGTSTKHRKTQAKVMTEGSEVAITALTVEPDGKSVLVTLTAPLRLTFFDALPFDPVEVSGSARLDYAP